MTTFIISVNYNKHYDGSVTGFGLSAIFLTLLALLLPSNDKLSSLCTFPAYVTSQYKMKDTF